MHAAEHLDFIFFESCAGSSFPARANASADFFPRRTIVGILAARFQALINQPFILFSQFQRVGHAFAGSAGEFGLGTAARIVPRTRE